MPAIGWIGVSSIAFVAVYFVAMRLVFLYEKKRVAEFFSEFAADTLYAGMSKRTASIMYGLNAVVIIIAATYLPGLGEQIADTTGLGRTFVGTAFVSVSTSLPELVVAAAAMRIGAVDMVFGNVLGSNLFNTVILAVDDFLYTKGPLLAKVSYTHSITANAAVAMTAIAVIGLTYRTNRKLVFFAWHSLGIIILYGFATCLLFVLR
jgi:cation:H+ antiporter